MRIDMIYYPTDLVAGPEPDPEIDVEASGRTFAALMTQALTEQFPDARVNVWYNPTEVHSNQDFQIHWSDGEIEPDERGRREREIREQIALIAGEVRAGRDWVVRVPVPF